MNQQQGTQVQLPENVTLRLKTQDVITILGALGEYGPHKAVNPVIKNLEQQLLSQQISPTPPSLPAPDSQAAEPIAHHPV